MSRVCIHDNKDFFFVNSGENYLLMIEDEKLTKEIYSAVMGIKQQY